MKNGWYYNVEGEQKGPVTLGDLEAALRDGEISRQTLVWRKGMPGWKTLDDAEELQTLFENAPPPLPPPPPQTPGSQPPPPPPQQPPPTKRKDRSGSAFPKGLGRIVAWLFKEIGPWLLGWLRARPVVSLTIVVFLIGGTVCAVVCPRPTSKATGKIRLDANPWAQVRWIRGADGKEVDLPQARTTPFLLTVPVGDYEARVEYPHAGGLQTCALQVRSEQPASCWFDLAPVDAKAYFQEIGW